MSAALQQKPEIKIKLTAVQGPHAGQVFSLDKSPLTIGRGPENDVVLLNDPQVSRTHAQIAVVDRDLEVTNLSQKNSIVVQGESVQKWKLTNNSSFRIGDTEFNVEYDLGQAVASVVPQKPAVAAAPKPKVKPKEKPKAKLALVNQAATIRAKPQPPAQAAGAPALRPRQMQGAQSGPFPGGPMMAARPSGGLPGFQPPPPAPKASFMASPKFKFYLIGLILLAVTYNYFAPNDQAAKNKKISSVLKYEDAVNTVLNSNMEKTKQELLKAKKKEKDSAQLIRIEENFIKGMRDFQLGNYTRAQEFFQLVLNLDPDHALAKRHLYLCKVRFDELVQEKLMLGESYFKKHNFRMCESLYKQVVDMFQGKNDDTKFQLAQKKAEECGLADQGVR